MPKKLVSDLDTYLQSNHEFSAGKILIEVCEEESDKSLSYQLSLSNPVLEVVFKKVAQTDFYFEGNICNDDEEYPGFLTKLGEK